MAEEPRESALPSHVRENVTFLQLPAEIVERILSFCTIFDICSVAMTSKQLRIYAESQYIWKKKWKDLSLKSGLRFPNSSPDTEASSSSSSSLESICNYKSMCLRLWKLCFQDQGIPRCVYCKQMTCLASCLDTWERKAVVDIGSKVTWLLTTTFAMRRHPSVLAVPRKRNSSTTVTSMESSKKCEHEIPRMHFTQPICILCNPERADQVFINMKRWQLRNCDQCSNHHRCLSSDHLMCCKNLLVVDNSEPEQNANSLTVEMQNLSVGESVGSGSGNPSNSPPSWESSLWTDVMGYLFGNVEDWEMVSPLNCLTNGVDLSTLMYYLEHVLEQFKMLHEVRKPSVSFVLCEPTNCSSSTRKKVAVMLFEKLKVARICFLNKALSVARLVEQETCIVIDSGANNTVVTLVVDGEAQVDQSQHVMVGGVAVAQYLAQAIEWNGLMQNVALSSLDTSRVKASCYLPYNLATEEMCKNPLKEEIYVRPHSVRGVPFPKVSKLELGVELYKAPEMMYASIGLPDLIRNSVKDLNRQEICNAFRHIILSGGNTELRGFSNRIMKDLRSMFPEYSGIINVHTYTGCRSWDVVMGATRFPVPPTLATNRRQVNKLGLPMWITREDFVVHGTDCLC